MVNANYTAKLVWLLATMYALDGAAADRTALLDKLDRAVLPGVLMDADRDGQVDGVPGCRFADLTAVARVPGRLWDGHNARPVYHAMIAQAEIPFVQLGTVRRIPRAALLRWIEEHTVYSDH